MLYEVITNSHSQENGSRQVGANMLFINEGNDKRRNHEQSFEQNNDRNDVDDDEDIYFPVLQSDPKLPNKNKTT